MIKRLKLTTSAFFVGLVFLLTTGKVEASEGTVERTGTTDARCYASSVMMSNFQYKILASCQNLKYPASPVKFAYLFWAIPIEGGGSQKLGALGVGKAEYATNKAFSELFVTAEKDDKARDPSNDVIMRGKVRPITLLTTGEPETSEPSITPSEEEEAESFGEILEKAQPTPAPIQKAEGILGFFKQGGVILAIVGFVILLILTALTRARG